MSSSNRLIGIGILLIAVSGADAGMAAQNPPASNGAPAGNEAVRVELQCVPVGAYWNGLEPTPGTPAGPGLAVLSLDLRPKDAEVHLDGRFIGRSRYFNGKKGHLFLEPGSYVLELRLDGYRAVRIDLEASDLCRYDLVHRLEKGPGQPQQASAEAYGKGVPLNRVFSSQPDSGEVGDPPPHKGKADLRLRSDLDPGNEPAPGRPSVKASLSLHVSPEIAAVFVDGVFLATARELARMHGPVATTAGERRLEIRAEGFRPWSGTLVLGPGEVKDLTIDLTPADSGSE